MTEEAKAKEVEEEALATSAEGEAEEAKGFITPDDGEPTPEPDKGGEGSKEDEASAAPGEKKEDEPTGKEVEAGEKKESEAKEPTADAAGKPGDDDNDDNVPKGVKKRISRAVRNQHEAERERDYYKGLAEGRGKPEAKAGEEDATPEEAVRPVQEDFETEEAYIEALTDFKMDERFAAHDTKAAEKAKAFEAEKATTSRQEAFQKKIDKAAEGHEDFNEVTFRNPDLAVTAPMLRECEELENGAEVVYHLGKNPEKAAEIARLPHKAMERALWGIEEGLKASAPAPKAETKKVSGAPEPIDASSGGGGGGGIDHEGESIEDFMKRENQKDLKEHGYG